MFEFTYVVLVVGFNCHTKTIFSVLHEFCFIKSRQYLSGVAREKIKLEKDERNKKSTGSLDRFFNKTVSRY